MAILIGERSAVRVDLQPQHVFGRHPSAATSLTNSEASRTHAVVIWDGEVWLLKDTSSNGTYINGRYLARGAQQVLNVEDQIQFGSDQAEIWFVKDISPPDSLLIPITLGLPAITLGEITALPSEDDPQISIYRTLRGQWMCETASSVYELQTGDRVGTQDKQWRFVSSHAGIETEVIKNKIPKEPKNLLFKFDVSQNEEHVSLSVQMDEDIIDLEMRNHHYLVLVLARKYLADKSSGIAESESGWIDKDLLCKMLGLSGNHINIQIYRFRKQFVDAYAEADHLPQIIERRTGEIRFSPNSVEIIGGVGVESHQDFINDSLRLN
ncbi:FHA domain-containing protein [Litoribrevibacter euphylliae]|uniref:FHA domain-containing protein n=1 Tax=Litoribrevibacter euphylliae TaxID=1834034 RepID=A0ABV7HKM1_9GAMM